MSELPLKREVVEELQRQNPAAVVDLVLQQAKAIVELERRVSQLEEKLGQSSGGGPGAAPFRIDPHKRKANPKRPGREQGHRGQFRASPEQIDQTIEVALKQCPHCGERIKQSRPIEQTIIELPAIKPMVVRLITHRGRCERCGKKLQSAHPLQVSRAVGAAGTQLGPRALAVAGLLRHEVGMTLRGCCAVMDKLFDLRVSAGGLSQGLDRLGRRLKGCYETLIEQVRASPVVHSDETSWWLENDRSQLWVFATEQETVYRVVKSRDRATFHQTIPPDYKGILVSDCLSVYDDATERQQKCYAHHLKAISAAKKARSAPSEWLEQVEHLLKSAIALAKKREAMDQGQWELHLKALYLAARVVLEETPRACLHEEALRARLWKQRDHLFMFLEHPGVNATNNLAERQLRPAVIRRKLSCGNRSQRGARTFEILTSLAATCRQRGEDFLQIAHNAARLQPI